ncbi:MAG: ABC transporter ATP-binding protein [Solobacterium sp.]|nr:ABC transporter ATP-binding protein [Solobacterium sp.]
MLLIDKTLLKLSKGLWRWILLITAVRFVILVATTNFAMVIGSFLGNMFSLSVTREALHDAVLSALYACVIIFCFQILQGELEYRCSAKARTELRKTIFGKVLRLDAGYIEKIGPTSAVTSSVDAVERIQVYYSEYLPSLLFSVIAPVFLFFRLKSYSSIIALFLCIVSLSLLPLNNIFRYHIEKLRKTYWHSLDDMTGYYLDGLKGMMTLKLFDKDKEHEKNLYHKADVLNQNINAFMKVNFTSFLVTESIIYLSIIISVYLAIQAVINNMLPLSSALTILLLGYSYFSSIRQLMNATHNALTSVSAAAKIEEILSVNTKRRYEPDLMNQEEYADGIYMKDVSFGYEGRDQVLHQVNISVKKGQTVALSGLSGCGKSTCANLMMRFLDPETGNIYMEGKPYYAMQPEEIRKKIIMVPQTVHLFSGTLRENLLMGKENVSEEELAAVLKDCDLYEFTQSLAEGLDTRISDGGGRLSGGQKQKIGIARALLSKAEYIVFDEATSSVDPESEKEIWDCIHRLARSRTLIIISHRLSTISGADRIYVLDHGNVIEEGNHQELLQKRGFYFDLFENQKILEEKVIV